MQFIAACGHPYGTWTQRTDGVIDTRYHVHAYSIRLAARPPVCLDRREHFGYDWIQLHEFAGRRVAAPLLEELAFLRRDVEAAALPLEPATVAAHACGTYEGDRS